MQRVTIASYNEEGSTTTPFNMMLVNSTSRYHVAIQALKSAAKRNEKVRLRLHELTSELTGRISEVTKFILAEKTGKLDSTMLTSKTLVITRTSRNLG
jgi:xylulose-5-phosphate/fructose-6-phosphate phosphoketolase